MLQRLTVVIGVMLFLTTLSAAQDRNTFRVGTASAARGQKVIGTIEVPPGVDPALSIPVALIHGAKPGPVDWHGGDTDESLRTYSYWTGFLLRASWFATG